MEELRKTFKQYQNGFLTEEEFQTKTGMTVEEAIIKLKG